MEGGFELGIFGRDDSSAMGETFVYNGSDAMLKVEAENVFLHCREHFYIALFIKEVCQKRLWHSNN